VVPKFAAADVKPQHATPLPALPGLLLGALTSLLRRPPATPPDTAFTARFRLSGIDPAQLAGYRDFFDYRLPGVPLSYFYLPAQRAQLALMLDKRFPYPLPGLIHSGNVLRLHAIPQAASALEIDVLTRLCHRPDEAPKIVCEVAFSQSGRPVASCTSDYRIAAKRRPKRAEPGEPEDFPESFAPTGWIVDQATIRRYARLSGDYNPIHLSALLARLFGCRGAIAHGMYSVGRAAAHIEHQTARPLTAISADFRRPVPLPAQAVLGLKSTDSRWGCYGVLLKEPKLLALSGRWET
jgi:acyl dehydratase